MSILHCELIDRPVINAKSQYTVLIQINLGKVVYSTPLQMTLDTRCAFMLHRCT